MSSRKSGNSVKPILFNVRELQSPWPNQMSVTTICGGRVDHAANSNAWPSARAGTGAEVS